MPFLSVTRLRIRAFRFLPGFALDTLRARRQKVRHPSAHHASLSHPPPRGAGGAPLRPAGPR